MKSIGKYFIFLYSLFLNRVSYKAYSKQFLQECVVIGISSLSLVAIVAMFLGAATAVQFKYNLKFLSNQNFLIGYSLRNIIIAELVPTVTGIVFAGKVGANIAGQLGSMRMGEQIDALEVMGINATTYLVLPKILAGLLVYPLLVILGSFLAIFSGYLVSTLILSVAPDDYIRGLQFMFDPHIIGFALCKSLVFAFLIISISSCQGFYVRREVVAIGQAGTRAVTYSCIAILAADYVLTQLLL